MIESRKNNRDGELIGRTVDTKAKHAIIRPSGQNMAMPRPLRTLKVKDVTRFLRVVANAATALIR